MTLAAEPPHMMSVTFPNNAAAAAVAAAAAMAAAQHNNGVVHQIVSPISNSEPMIFFSECLFMIYCKVRSSRPVYYSILELFGQRSQYISIKFLLHKQSENP